MTCQVILRFKAKEDSIEKIKSLMREILPDTRAYDGFVELSLTQDQDDPTAFAIVEQWDARKYHEAYLQWRIDTGFMNKFGELLNGEPSISYLSYVGV